MFSTRQFLFLLLTCSLIFISSLTALLAQDSPNNSSPKAKSGGLRQQQKRRQSQNTNQTRRVLTNEISDYGFSIAGTLIQVNGQSEIQDTVQSKQLRDHVLTKADLKTTITSLSDDLDLNAIFDTEAFRVPRSLSINLEKITAAEALNAICLQENLFCRKVAGRTLLITSESRKQNFQPLVLKTFYLTKSKSEDIRNVLVQALPPAPGRPPTQVIIDKRTNSVTVRDTPEALQVFERLIQALDRNRFEIGNQSSTSDYEITLQLLAPISSSKGTELRPQNIVPILRKIETELGLTNYEVAASFIQRVSQFGQVETKGVYSSNDEMLLESPVFAEFYASGFRASDEDVNQVSIDSIRVGLRVPVMIASSKQSNATAVNYEQIGLTTKLLNVTLDEPAIVGTFNVPRPNKQVVVVLTVKAATSAARGIAKVN